MTVNAQDSLQSEIASVEKSLFGIQLGIVTLSAHNEFRLSRQFAFRAEFGVALGVYRRSILDDEETYLILPVISAEPRWYYNLSKRLSKNKNIARNSGNYISVRAIYYSDLFLISSDSDIKVADQVAIVPKWGMRRVYGKHFTFETGVGLGPIFYFSDSPTEAKQFSDVFLDLTLRIGYNF